MKHPLKIYLEKNGWSVAEFIERKRLKLSRSFIQDIISGVRNPSKPSAEILSEATGIPKEVLIFPDLEHKRTDYNKSVNKNS